MASLARIASVLALAIVAPHAASAAGLPPLLPAPGGRRHDGRPVFLCGRVPLVLDAGRGMLLMQKGGAGGGVWVPASLEDLAGEVKRRQVGK